jgi:hypothetical protein
MEYLKILAAHSVFTDEFFARSIVSSSDNDSFGERYMQDQQDLMAGDNDDPHDAAVAGNAAAPQALNQDNGPGEDGDGNENRDNAAAATPDNDVAPPAAN